MKDDKEFLEALESRKYQYLYWIRNGTGFLL